MICKAMPFPCPCLCQTELVWYAAPSFWMTSKWVPRPWTCMPNSPFLT